ncbi:hypothetical protein XaC1_60 [Xanthomonas phage XaC1]|nr:hypothetical protein XaC1_60 [Xanthomonas phage XaC1]
MNAIQFAAKVKESFLKYFPNGFLGSSKYQLGGGIHFTAGLVSNANDISSGYRVNDIISLSFGIHDNVKYNTEEEIQGKIVIEFVQNSFSTKPEPGSYMAMGRVKIPARKINNTPEKAIESLDKVFQKTAELIKAEVLKNNLYRQENINEKYLNSIK